MSPQQKLEESIWAEYDEDPEYAMDEPEEQGEWGALAEFGEDVVL
jgi:hypothetical protein